MHKENRKMKNKKDSKYMYIKITAYTYVSLNVSCIAVKILKTLQFV